MARTTIGHTVPLDISRTKSVRPDSNQRCHCFSFASSAAFGDGVVKIARLHPDHWLYVFSGPEHGLVRFYQSAPAYAYARLRRSVIKRLLSTQYWSCIICCTSVTALWSSRKYPPAAGGNCRRCVRQSTTEGFSAKPLMTPKMPGEPVSVRRLATI